MLKLNESKKISFLLIFKCYSSDFFMFIIFSFIFFHHKHYRIMNSKVMKGKWKTKKGETESKLMIKLSDVFSPNHRCVATKRGLQWNLRTMRKSSDKSEMWLAVSLKGSHRNRNESTVVITIIILYLLMHLYMMYIFLKRNNQNWQKKRDSSIVPSNRL